MSRVKRNYTYSVGDIANAIPNWTLTCTKAGTTSTDIINIQAGTIVDGTCEWNCESTDGGGSGEGVVTWEEGKDYQINTLTVQNNNLYVCIQNHTSSSSFEDDVESGKWALLMGDSGTSNNALGTVISHMGTTPPMNYLACDGTIYNIEDYQELADYINTQFGSYNFFGGNGTTTFAVPDLRGEFLRGTGTNSHNEQGDGGNVGEHQDGSAIRGEWLNPNGANSHQFYTDKEYQRALGSDYPANVINEDSTLHRDYITGSNSLYERTITATTSSIGNQDYGQQLTIRPTNTAVLYCIRYNTPKGKEIEIWQPSTDYEINQLICDTKGLYICKVDHTSSNDFLTDVLAGKWSWIGKEGANNMTQTTLYSGSSPQTAQTTVEYSLSDSTDNYDYLLLTYGNDSFKTDIIPVNDLFYSNGFFFSLTYNYDVNGWIQGKTNKTKVDIKVTTATQGNATIIKSIVGIKLNTLTTADMAELSMPSDIYVNIPITHNDWTINSYTAPANGYVSVAYATSTSSGSLGVYTSNLSMYMSKMAERIPIIIPVQKDTVCSIRMSGGTLQDAKFFYTVGDAKDLGLLVSIRN